MARGEIRRQYPIATERDGVFAMTDRDQSILRTISADGGNAACTVPGHMSQPALAGDAAQMFKYFWPK